MMGKYYPEQRDADRHNSTRFLSDLTQAGSGKEPGRQRRLQTKHEGDLAKRTSTYTCEEILGGIHIGIQI
jgi:hypothetical protein